MMNLKAKEKLEVIAKKEITSLTPPNKLFMRARRNYLTAKQKRYYASIIK